MLNNFLPLLTFPSPVHPVTGQPVQTVGLGTGTAIVFVFLLMFAAIIGIVSLVFWIMMLVDCAKTKKLNSEERATWIIILALLGVIGAIAYYFVVKNA